MKKKFEEVCTHEQIDKLVSFRITKKSKNELRSRHKFVEKMIKRCRLLGLLPFSHSKLTA